MPGKVIWKGKNLEKLKKLCKKVDSFVELRKQGRKVFPNFSTAAVENAARRHPDFVKHLKTRGAKARELLEDYCKKAKDWIEVRQLITGDPYFSHKRWGNIETKILIHPEWTEHFPEKKPKKPKQKKSEDELRAESLIKGKDKLLKKLRKQISNIEELSRIANLPKTDIHSLIDELREQGYDIRVEGNQVNLEREPVGEKVIPLEGISRKRSIKILVVEGSHLGSRYQQATLLKTVFKIAEIEKVNLVFQVGNLVAGLMPGSRSSEVFLSTYEGQRDYVDEVYPKVPGVKTYVIAGGQDLTWKTKKGRNIIRDICANRPDMVYSGDMRATFTFFDKTQIIAVHAGSETAPYAQSYPLQGILENLSDHADEIKAGKRTAPDMVLLGGYNTAGQLPDYMGMIALGLPTFRTLTPHLLRMKKRTVDPTIGAYLLELKFKKDGRLDKKRSYFDLIPLTTYQKEHDYRGQVQRSLGVDGKKRKPAKLIAFDKQILRILQKEPRLGEISRRLKCSKAAIRTSIRKLQKLGYVIRFDVAEKKTVASFEIRRNFTPIPYEKLFVNTVKLGSTGDTHLGSIHQQFPLLEKTYKIAVEDEVERMFHLGDLLTGVHGPRGENRERWLHTIDEQAYWVIKHYPRVERKDGKLLETDIISGSHDLRSWYCCGHDPVEHVTEMREDLHYCGKNEATLDIENLRFKIQHPGGGTAYALSYNLQKAIETFFKQMANDIGDEDEANPVDAYMMAHYHKAAFFMYKGIAGFLNPCLQMPIEYMRKRNIPAFLGMWVMTYTTDENDIVTRIRPHYIGFTPVNDPTVPKRLLSLQ